MKKKPKKSVPMATPENDRQRASVSVRKIKNGYISERSGHLPDDPYKSEEMFHPKKPKIQMAVGEPDEDDMPRTKAQKSATKKRVSKMVL